MARAPAARHRRLLRGLRRRPADPRRAPDRGGPRRERRRLRHRRRDHPAVHARVGAAAAARRPVGPAADADRLARGVQRRDRADVAGLGARRVRRDAVAGARVPGDRVGPRGPGRGRAAARRPARLGPQRARDHLRHRLRRRRRAAAAGPPHPPRLAPLLPRGARAARPRRRPAARAAGDARVPGGPPRRPPADLAHPPSGAPRPVPAAPGGADRGGVRAGPDERVLLRLGAGAGRLRLERPVHRADPGRRRCSGSSASGSAAGSPTSPAAGR